MTTDATALQRQNRRIERLKEQGVTRATVLVHSECKPALEGLRHHFVDPDKAQALASLVEQLHDKKAPTNVAQVRQLSPFRYPGGKTWLVPEVRKWLTASKITPSVFVEPFAGGAMAGLSAAASVAAAALPEREAHPGAFHALEALIRVLTDLGVTAAEAKALSDAHMPRWPMERRKPRVQPPSTP